MANNPQQYFDVLPVTLVQCAQQLCSTVTARSCPPNPRTLSYCYAYFVSVRFKLGEIRPPHLFRVLLLLFFVSLDIYFLCSQ
jgi:hypothetical protein